MTRWLSSLYFLHFAFLCIAPTPIVATILDCEPLSNQLLRDLLVVDYWDRYHAHTMPVLYNHLLQGGYFNMPSARMGRDGELAFGYASVPPYLLWTGRCQLTERLEVSGAYRIFKGIPDPILSPYGFGDLSDKGANVKLAIILPEDSDYRLPGVAIGCEDFLGTRNFKAQYIVATQVFPDYGLEISLGYGVQRIRRWFGGAAWLPFYRSNYPYLEGLALVAEYDATPYHDCNVEPHPKGRQQRCPLNAGIKYRLWNCFDFSLSYVRGHSIAFAASAQYNFGHTEGFLPKIDNPLPYRAPVNQEPLDGFRPPEWLAADLLFALRDQGFDLLDALLIREECGLQNLRLVIYNRCYREEAQVRERLSSIFAALIPSDIDYITAVMDVEGLAIQEYRIPVAFLRRYADNRVCELEFAVMAPEREVSPLPCHGTYQRLYSRSLPMARFLVLPKTDFFFGSAAGKLKYTLGVSLRVDGFLCNEIYYNVIASYNAFQDLKGSKSIDRLNPSQIINVRSDILRYCQRPGISIDLAYLQKSWNLSQGWYARAAIGLFEIEYGGIAGELLYYPVDSPWAVGIEGACLRKRTLSGLGFSDKVRKLNGFHASYHGFLGSQFLLSGYYDWKATQLDLRVKVGKFLANDTGVRFEVARYFPSGLRVMLWYTRTNARDYINGERYFDKGIAVSIPLDIFYTRCVRGYWNYGLAAWLRDIGITGGSGKPLYETIYEERQ